MIIERNLDDMEKDIISPFRSFYENVMDSGCYYLSPEICKDIIITSGVRGIHTACAIKMIRQNMKYIYEILEELIPMLRYMDNNIILCYAGDIAECLVEAAETGKGIEITIGYPKVLVLKVN